MADVQPEHGTAPIAYELLEAMMRDPMHSLTDRIWIWVLRNTYGRRHHKTKARRKFCAFTWQKIASAVVADRSNVSRSGRVLIATKRLILDAGGYIGIQKDSDKWLDWTSVRTNGVSKDHGRGVKRPRKGCEKTTPPVASVLSSQYAREVLSVESYPGSLNRTSIATSLPQAEGTKSKKLTPQQQLVRYFKEAKGVDANDTDWDRKHWNGRIGKEANAVLRAFYGDVKMAGEYILIKGEEWKDLPDWGLNGIAAAAGRDKRLIGRNHESMDRTVDTASMDGSRGNSRLTSSRSLAWDALRAIKHNAVQAKKDADLGSR